MEIKLVITIKETHAIVGVQSPGKDPYFETAEGDIPIILGKAMGIVLRAEEHWTTQPKNPAISLPSPEPKKEAVTATSKSGSSSKGAKPVPKADAQPSMF